MNNTPNRNTVTPALRIRHDLFMAVTNALRLTADADAPTELANLLLPCGLILDAGGAAPRGLWEGSPSGPPACTSSQLTDRTHTNGKPILSPSQTDRPRQLAISGDR